LPVPVSRLSFFTVVQGEGTTVVSAYLHGPSGTPT